MKPDFTLEFIKTDQGLRNLSDALANCSAFALDIETVEWWNRSRERIALVQIAFCRAQKMKVAVIDALAALNFKILKSPLEEQSIIKAIHNAAFDATRITEHYEIHTSPVHDTMLAARFNKEKRYSLKAQAALHLNLQLDKAVQKSDWSRRPLDTKQLYYAATDAYATLLLYEHQTSRNLRYGYRPKIPVSSDQGVLPLAETRSAKSSFAEPIQPDKRVEQTNLTKLAAAILEIVVRLPTRYSPDSLAISLEIDRTGLAGWIIDQTFGRDAEIEEEAVRLAIAELCERKLLRVTDSRRLEATEKGAEFYENLKDG